MRIGWLATPGRGAWVGGLCLLLLWGMVWGGSALAAPATAPTLLAPANGATDVLRPVPLYWSLVDGALKYRVRVATDEAFTDIVWYQAYDHPTHRCEVSGLLGNTKYYWCVDAYDGELGPTSEVWTFTTAGDGNAPPAPVLRSPENGATGLIRNPRLTWYAVDTATSYWVQVATTENFSNLVWNRSHTEPTAALADLEPNTTYWWRVYAKRGTVHSVWSSVWRFTTGTDSGLPAAPVLVAPENGATGQPVTLRLTWQAVDTALYYIVQVATSETFATTVWSRGYAAPATTAEITGLQPKTRYFWRVRARNEVGVSPWSTVWRFTTTAVGPPTAAPVLLTPANRATNQPLALNLTWKAVERALAYKVQVSKNEAFTSLVVNRSTTATSTEVSGLAPNTRYWWRVAAGNNDGVGPWSAIWSFTTITVAAPSVAPTLLSPSNGATDLGVSVRVYWTAVEGATRYKLLVASNESFTNLVVEKYLTTTSETLSLQPNTRYWWRVVALNEGGRGPWSTIWRFSTGAGTVPAAPLLISPENGATGVSTTAHLSWSPVDGAYGYWLQVSRNDGFTSLIWSKATHDTWADVTGLTPGVRYYWRVIAANVNGYGPWSEVWSFTVAR